ncbi:hypothetical protein PHJA_001983900 [Phtheirospermum japonicum]|uniref:Uncharacterized protein n=1 Tax=Phtheirospermum japonicum TaxID=374723 RepID=A0A830CFH9_9LAMI|nr:hypothetical protein PHJA_001983900 [Phtheirospermum japonicum]
MFRRIAKSRQILEAVLVLGFISWSTARVPAAAKTAAGHVVRFSTYLFNHHVVFLIGNAIIVLLFVICRRNDALSSGGGGDLYDDYVKHSEAANRGDTAPPPPPDTDAAEVGGGGDEEKQIVVCAEETVAAPQRDDVAAVIEKAERQIRRFQRTQSERLRREIGARPQAELRRSESENRRKSVSSVDEMGAVDMERLSSEEFRRTVDAFIDKHWSKKTMKQNRFEEYEKYQLLEMA